MLTREQQYELNDSVWAHIEEWMEFQLSRVSTMRTGEGISIKWGGIDKWMGFEISEAFKTWTIGLNYPWVVIQWNSDLKLEEEDYVRVVDFNEIWKVTKVRIDRDWEVLDYIDIPFDAFFELFQEITGIDIEYIKHIKFKVGDILVVDSVKEIEWWQREDSMYPRKTMEMSVVRNWQALDETLSIGTAIFTQRFRHVSNVVDVVAASSSEVRKVLEGMEDSQ